MEWLLGATGWLLSWIGVAMGVALLWAVGMVTLTVSLALMVEAYRAVRMMVLRRRMRVFLRESRR